MQNSYTVITASAGSGKTYTLVQRLLMICLMYENQHTHIKNILALTFTNKAANEMKERILNWLEKFTQDDYVNCDELIQLQTAMKKENQHVGLDVLHRRSKKLLDYILHHYSILNIGTIDKFNSRLVRNFSYELDLAKNFNLEIQPEPFLMEAVDQILNQIGTDQKVSDTFLDYVQYSLDNQKRVYLNKTLYKSAKEYIKDIHYNYLKNNSNFDYSSYKEITKQLRQEIVFLKKESKILAEKSLAIIKEKGLEITDFSGGKTRSIKHFFDDYFSKEKVLLYESIEKEENKIIEYRKGSSPGSKDKQGIILEILDFLILNRELIIKNYISIKKKEKILDSLLPLMVNSEIQNELAKIEDENDIVLLSKFNVLINENLKNEPSLFIYEKIGTQFQHYFFDEFQDTSSIQWENFIPLRDHTISYDGSSFTLVGDPKQSIYRFRGGDSQIMLDIINNEDNSQKKAQVVVLENNFRSARNIVKFNNELYEFLSANLQQIQHRDLFGKNAQQIAASDSDGRVRVNIFEKGNNDDFLENVAQKMQHDIQECIDNGFLFSDITILCRNNTDILNYSQKLGILHVNYHGKSTPIKLISEKGLTLELSDTLCAVMYFLQWKSQPKNINFFVRMMYHLNQLKKIQIDDFSAEMINILEKPDYQDIVEYVFTNYGIQLENHQQTKLNLYNWIEYYVHEFSVKGIETNFILNFLEMLYEYTQNPVSTLKDFIKYWEEEARKISIQASENVDAIQIMTIHKAKGLEFPIVFYPVKKDEKLEKFKNWMSTDGIENLSAINTNAFSKELETYDSEIEKFNRDNKYRNVIDKLCVEYVATTRPVEQLFLYLETIKDSENREIIDFIEKNNPKKEDSFDLYPATSEDSFCKKEKSKKKTYSIMKLDSIQSNKINPSTIQIATPSKSYQARNRKVKLGILTHEILAKINSKEDVEKVLTHYVLQGIVSIAEKEKIATNVEKIIAEYPNYFQKDLTIVNEKEIMFSYNGISEIYRPDRLIETENGYIIIDFKTGEKKEKHLQQIAKYQSVIENIGKNVLKTELIYLDSLEF